MWCQSIENVADVPLSNMVWQVATKKGNLFSLIRQNLLSLQVLLRADSHMKATCISRDKIETFAWLCEKLA